MDRKKVETKFALKDKLIWWASNLLELLASVVLVAAVIISAPFRGFKK